MKIIAVGLTLATKAASWFAPDGILSEGWSIAAALLSIVSTMPDSNATGLWSKVLLIRTEHGRAAFSQTRGIRRARRSSSHPSGCRRSIENLT